MLAYLLKRGPENEGGDDLSCRAANPKRPALFKGLRIASILAVISGLADPRFMVEIEVMAAKAA